MVKFDPAGCLPCDVGEHEVHLPRKLRVGDADGRSLGQHCEVACAPVGDILDQNELEGLVRVVNLKPGVTSCPSEVDCS